RRKSASVRRTGTSTSRRAPFTVRLIARDALMRLLQGSPCQHGGELPAISGRDVHVLHAVQLAASLARFAEQAGACARAGQHLLDVARAYRRRRDAAERERSARDLAAPIFLEQRRRRDDGEVAVPARKLEKGVAVAFAPEREANARDELAFAQRGCHQAGRELRK